MAPGALTKPATPLIKEPCAVANSALDVKIWGQCGGRGLDDTIAD